MKNKINIRKITLTGIFIAISVIGSLFSFPVLGSKCAPIQHLMNIMGAVFLGPWYTLAAAFITSILRNLLGLGTLMAFPGSMCGALLSGVLCIYRRSDWYRDHRRAFSISGGGICTWKYTGSSICICCAVSDQYLRRCSFSSHHSRRYEKERYYGTIRFLMWL